MRTPAVRMTPREGRAYAVALAVAGALLHAGSAHPSCRTTSRACWGERDVLPGGAVGVRRRGGGLCLGVVDAHDVELLSALLRSTEGVHALGVDLATAGIEWAFTLPEPFRTKVVHALMSESGPGDALGGGSCTCTRRRWTACPDAPHHAVQTRWRGADWPAPRRVRTRGGGGSRSRGWRRRARTSRGCGGGAGTGRGATGPCAM